MMTLQVDSRQGWSLVMMMTGQVDQQALLIIRQVDLQARLMIGQ